ncbi:MAG: SPFH domain-containing protein, partial [Chloroflexota bacterium]
MGIEAFLGVIATGGFLIGLAGIAFIVVNASRGQGVRNGIVMAVAGFVLGLVFLVISEGLVTVQPTQRVVVFNVLTGNLEEPLEPGIHIVIPGIEQTTPYRVSRQEYTMSGISGEGNRTTDDAIEARSIDGQEVSLDVTIIFTIDPENVNRVHENWSDSEQGFLEGLIRPTIRSITRDVVATARAEQIFG